MPSSTIRVLIVHGHPISRRGLALSLGESPDVAVVGEAATGEEAIALLEQVHPDVIFLDVGLPGMGSVRAIREIHAVAPAVKIMVLSTFAEGDRVQEALHAGAIGYVLNDNAIDQLLDAIRQVVRGVASPGGDAIARSDDRNRPKRGDELTEREREVLALVIQGRSNEAIAEHLVITPAMVKFHLRNIRSKLGTSRHS